MRFPSNCYCWPMSCLAPRITSREISWLHDRNYFLPHRSIAIALMVLAVVLVLTTNEFWFGLLVWIALVACAMIAATTSAAEGLVLFLAALSLSLLLYSGESSLAVLGRLAAEPGARFGFHAGLHGAWRLSRRKPPTSLARGCLPRRDRLHPADPADGSRADPGACRGCSGLFWRCRSCPWQALWRC